MKANNYLLTKQAMDYNDIKNMLSHYRKSGKWIEKDQNFVPEMLTNGELGAKYNYKHKIPNGPSSVSNKGMGLNAPENMRGKIFIDDVRNDYMKKIYASPHNKMDYDKLVKSDASADTTNAMFLNHENAEIKNYNNHPYTGSGFMYGHTDISNVVAHADNNMIYGGKKTLSDMLKNKSKDIKFSTNGEYLKSKSLPLTDKELENQLGVVDSLNEYKKLRMSRGENKIAKVLAPTHLVTPEENRGFKGLDKVQEAIKNGEEPKLGRKLVQDNFKIGSTKVSKKYADVMFNKEMGLPKDISKTDKENLYNEFWNKQQELHAPKVVEQKKDSLLDRIKRKLFG